MNTHHAPTKKPSDDPESRLLDNVRNWIDVLPWLRLVRVCRVAGGPVWLAHTLLVALVWMAGISVLGGAGGAALAPPAIGSLSSLSSLPLATSTAPSDLVAGLPGLTYPAWEGSTPSPAKQPTRSPLSTTLRGGEGRGEPESWPNRVVERGEPEHWLRGAAAARAPANWKMIVWTILLWLPTTMALLRVGALLTAGRDMPSYVGTFRAVCGRLKGALLIVILPSLVATLFWSVAAGLTWLAAWIGGADTGLSWANLVALPLVLPATVVAALLILGGRFAVPLALTAQMVESAPDPIDSLSRGYEYTLRRLPQMVLLISVAGAIAAVVILGFVALAYAGEQLADSFGPTNAPLVHCLALLPSIVAVMLLWSMTGGIYLLLRQSAGGQEVEQIAIEDEHWKSPALPSVHRA